MPLTDVINIFLQKFLGKTLHSNDADKITQGIKKTVFVQAVSYLLVFAGNILMVRVAGMENYGLYVTVISWMSLLSVFAGQGMEDAVLAEIPPSLAGGSFNGAKKIVRFANKIIFIGAVVTSLVFFIIIKSDLVPLFSNNGTAFSAALFNVFFFAFIIVNQQSLQAFNRFYASQLADKIIKPLLLLVAFAIFYLYGANASAMAAINITTVVQFVCALLVLFFLKDTFKNTRADNKADEQPLRYGYSNFYFFIISLLYLLKAKIAIFIFGFVGNAADTGVFNILSRLADFVVVPFFIIHSVVPQLFSKHRDADKKYKKELFNRITLICSAGAIFIFLCMALMGKFLLGLYNSTLVASYPLLLILCAAQFLYSLFGPGSALLMMQGRQKQAAFVLIADVMVSIILFAVFIKGYGLTGAVWATVISVFLYNLLLRILVNKIIN